MAKGYWVAFADLTDPEGYKAYVQENANAFKKYGGRFLVRVRLKHSRARHALGLSS